MNIPNDLPGTEIQYLKKLVNVLYRNFDDMIIGIYLFGSASYGGYSPGKSDLDIQVVVEKSFALIEKKKLVNLTSHKKLPCPARKLELVCYPASALNPVLQSPEFDINFNTGKEEKEHICFNSKEEPSHWFLLDIAVGRELGFNLIGPAPDKVFGKIPRQWILQAMYDCISWYEQHEPNSIDLILNTCRCWAFAETNQMYSKQDGLLWVLQKPDSPDFLKSTLKYQKGELCLNQRNDILFFLRKVKNILLTIT